MYDPSIRLDAFDPTALLEALAESAYRDAFAGHPFTAPNETGAFDACAAAHDEGALDGARERGVGVLAPAGPLAPEAPTHAAVYLLNAESAARYSITCRMPHERPDRLRGVVASGLTSDEARQVSARLRMQFPSAVFTTWTDSLADQIKRAAPEATVVRSYRLAA